MNPIDNNPSYSYLKERFWLPLQNAYPHIITNNFSTFAVFLVNLSSNIDSNYLANVDKEELTKFYDNFLQKVYSEYQLIDQSTLQLHEQQNLKKIYENLANDFLNPSLFRIKDEEELSLYFNKISKLPLFSLSKFSNRIFNDIADFFERYSESKNPEDYKFATIFLNQSLKILQEQSHNLIQDNKYSKEKIELDFATYLLMIKQESNFITSVNFKHQIHSILESFIPVTFQKNNFKDASIFYLKEPKSLEYQKTQVFVKIESSTLPDESFVINEQIKERTPIMSSNIIQLGVLSDNLNLNFNSHLNKLLNLLVNEKIIEHPQFNKIPNTDHYLHCIEINCFINENIKANFHILQETLNDFFTNYSSVTQNNLLSQTVRENILKFQLSIDNKNNKPSRKL